MQWVLQWLGGLLGGPFAKAAVDAYKAKLQSGTDRDKLAADLATRELDVQQAEIAAQTQLRIAQIGKWYEPEHLFGYVLVFYVGKVLIFDAALHLGSTDAVRGSVGTWAGWIMAFYVGKRGIENVARILKR